MVARSIGGLQNMDLRRGGGSERDSLNSSSSQLSNHDGFRLPDGVRIPSSIDISMLQGDILEILKPLPADRINAAFDQYDHQIKARGEEIRNKRAYLRGILKAPGGRRYGLPHGVSVPPSVTQSMLEDKELIDILKNMSAKDINSCLRDYDEQIRKKCGMIRNKTAYLMGIIKSGPHYALPQGVVLPSTVTLASLQGELLETIQRLPSAHINVGLQEYDEQIQKKGDSIRNKTGYLLGIMKRMKKRFEEEASEHIAFQKQLASQSQESPSSHSSPTREDGYRQSRYQSSPPANISASKGCADNSILQELNLKPGENQQDTLNRVTESFVKVTNELVVERKARNDLEEEVKKEQNRREEANQRALKLMSELNTEKEQRERSAMEVKRLKKDLTFERSLRETAEEKVNMLEEGREHEDRGEQKSWDAEESQLKKLEMELAIERGLREKTERLLQAAEDRISDLSRELKLAQENLHQERTNSPFGNWMTSSPMSISHAQDGEDKKMQDIGPSLSGISEFVSLTDFDPATFNFGNAEDSRSVHRNSDLEPRDRLSSELKCVSSAYSSDEILIGHGEITRHLLLDANQTSESVQVDLTLKIPDGYPNHGNIDVDAAIADDSACSEVTQKCVEESLPSLIEACRSEARGCMGNETILSILTTADYWVQIDWSDMQAKMTPGSGQNLVQNDNQVEICRLLVKSANIDDGLSLKHMTSKHGLGGYVMAGHPGFLLLEGLEENCERCVENLKTLAQDDQNVGEIPKGPTFTVVGKALGMVSDLKSGMSLPAKLAVLSSHDGNEQFNEACEKVGLAELFGEEIQ